ncbi:MAG TPA: oligosaccharide flippase family protein, partial [Candidatus Polarisedimenticolia bacterium]|nr:oligosaccharide flippase family protein [Candidatus Polarisedimenticolia bacterium]
MLRILRDSFKHTSIYTVGNLATKAVGLLMIPVYTHFLTPREYGILDMLDLTIILFGMITGMGMGSALFRFYYATESKDERREVVGSALLFSSLVAGLLGLAVALGADRIAVAIFRGPGFSFYLRMAILSFCVGTAAETCRNYLRVRQLSGLFVTSSLIQLVISLGLNIYFIAFRHMGVFGFLLSSLITNLLASVALLAHTVITSGVSFSIPKTRQMLAFGAPFVLTGIGAFIMNFADRYFLNLYAGLGQVGIYALGYKFGFMLNMLAVAPFLQMWEAQMFVVQKETSPGPVYARVFEYFAALLLLAVLGVSIFIQDILRVVASPEYAGAAAIVPIVALAYVLNGWGQYFRLGMLLTKRTQVIAVIMTATGVLTIGLYVVLIRSHHALGAAMATLLSFAFMMTWTYIESQRLYRVPYDLRRIAAVAGLAVLCYAGAWASARFLGPFTWHGFS